MEKPCKPKLEFTTKLARLRHSPLGIASNWLARLLALAGLILMMYPLVARPRTVGLEHLSAFALGMLGIVMAITLTAIHWLSRLAEDLESVAKSATKDAPGRTTLPSPD